MTYEELLLKYLQNGYKPTRAVENALEDYNNSRGLREGISIRTAWNKYKKIIEKKQFCSEKANDKWYTGGVTKDRQGLSMVMPLVSSMDRLTLSSSQLFFEMWMFEPYDKPEAIWYGYYLYIHYAI